MCYAQLTVSQYAEMTDTGSSSGSDGVNDLAVDKFGTIFSTGYFTTGAGTSSFATMAYTDMGGDQWSGPQTYTGPGAGMHVAVVCSLDDNHDFLYVAGYSQGDGTGLDIVVLKYEIDDGTLSPTWANTGSGTGVRRWNYSGSINGDDVPVTVLVDAGTEDVFVLGTAYTGATTKNNYVLLKYESDGDMDSDFPVYYDAGNSGDDIASDMVFGIPPPTDDPEGGDNAYVYVTGYSYGGSTPGRDYLTTKYAKTDGSVQSGWPERYDSTEGDDFAVAIAANGDGVFVTGYIPESSGTDTITGVNYFTIRYTTGGVYSWGAGYDGPPATDSDIPFDIAVDDNYVWVTGHSSGTSSGLDILTVKYNVGNGADATGWSGGKRYDGGSNLVDRGVELAIEGGNVYITGFRTVDTDPGAPVVQNTDPITLKYDSSGTLEWSIGFPTGTAGGGGSDYSNAIVLDRTNSSPNVYVKAIIGGIAYTNSTTGFDFKTIKYSQVP